MKKAVVGLFALAGSALATSPVMAQSAKATFAYDSLISLPAASTGTQVDNGWTPVLRSKLKLANQKDLFINASLQCGIVTDTTVKSFNGTTDTAEARATVRVRVKITDGNGEVSYAQPSSGRDATGAADSDGVVFCDRIQTLTAKFSGLNCTINPIGSDDGITDGTLTCTDPEELQLILKTLNANAFNFVAADLPSGDSTIDVEAKTSAKVTTTSGSLGSANAFIGAGSVAIESVRMVKGNTGETITID